MISLEVVKINKHYKNYGYLVFMRGFFFIAITYNARNVFLASAEAWEKGYFYLRLSNHNLLLEKNSIIKNLDPFCERQTWGGGGDTAGIKGEVRTQRLSSHFHGFLHVRSHFFQVADSEIIISFVRSNKNILLKVHDSIVVFDVLANLFD